MDILFELERKQRGIPEVELREAYGASIAAMRDLQMDNYEHLARALTDRGAGTSRRLIACWAAGEIQWLDATPHLWSILVADEDVAFEAAKAIIKIATDDHTGATFRQILTTRELGAVARAAAAHALGSIGFEGAIDELIEVLVDPAEVKDVRCHCAEALGMLGAGKAASALLTTLHDPNAELRFWSAYALGELRDPQAIESLEKAALLDNEVVDGLGSVADEARRALQALDQET